MMRCAGRSSQSFLPTPSARRATSRTGRSFASRWISTHALREEGDARNTRQ